jgi:hypothetical protein
VPFSCQLLRPTCLVLGIEVHDGLGLTPIGVPAPSKTMWASIGTSGGIPGIADLPAATVWGGGEQIVRREHDTKLMRPHLSIINFLPPPPAVTVTPVVDLGLFVVNTLLGATTPIWAAMTVKAKFDAGEKPVAVIMLLPGLCAGSANQMVCSDPCNLPMSTSVQMPTTVYAGMSGGDIVAGLIAMAVDMLISGVANAISHALFGGGPAGAVPAAVAKKAAQQVGRAILKEVAKHGLEEGFEKVLSDGLKKLTEQLQGGPSGPTSAAPNSVSPIGVGRFFP